MKRIPKEVREYMAELGRKGGTATSERKTRANKKNARKRWKKAKGNGNGRK